MTTLLAILPILGMVACVLLFIRNERVYAFRRALLALVSAEARRRIERDEAWVDLYQQFEAISYDQQVIRFWRPLPSWLSGELRAIWTEDHR